MHPPSAIGGPNPTFLSPVGEKTGAVNLNPVAARHVAGNRHTPPDVEWREPISELRGRFVPK